MKKRIHDFTKFVAFIIHPTRRLFTMEFVSLITYRVCFLDARFMSMPFFPCNYPSQISTGAPPAPFLSPTFANLIPSRAVISQKVLSALSLSLYPTRIKGGFDPSLRRRDIVRERAGKEDVL